MCKLKLESKTFTSFDFNAFNLLRWQLIARTITSDQTVYNNAKKYQYFLLYY